MTQKLATRLGKIAAAGLPTPAAAATPATPVPTTAAPMPPDPLSRRRTLRR